MHREILCLSVFVFLCLQYDTFYPETPRLTKVNQSEPKGIQVNPSEPKWTQVNPSEPKETKVNSSEPKWTQVNNNNRSRWTTTDSKGPQGTQTDPNCCLIYLNLIDLDWFGLICDDFIWFCWISVDFNLGQLFSVDFSLFHLNLVDLSCVTAVAATVIRNNHEYEIISNTGSTIIPWLSLFTWMNLKVECNISRGIKEANKK